MHYSDTYKMPDKNIGVLIKDRDFTLGKELRQALKEGKKVFLVKKPVDDTGHPVRKVPREGQTF